MEKRKLFIRITCVVLAALIVLSLLAAVISTGAAAATSSSIQAEINDLTGQKDDIQSRMDDIQSKIDSLDYEKATVLEKKQILDEKNTLAQQELDVIQDQIDIIDGLISNMQQDLEAARAEEAYQRERWLTRVRAMEEHSTLSYMEVLFDATSFSDLLTRLDLINEVMTYDAELEQAYIEARENVEALEAQAESLFADNEANRAEMEVKKAQLEADIETATLLIAELENNIEENNKALAEQQKKQEEIASLIVEKEAELAAAKAAEEAARAAAEAARRAQQQQQQTSSGGQSPNIVETGESASSSGTWMMWPSYTTTINSSYGYRIHPIQNVRKFHSGTDIGASYGTAIWAAAGGTVITAATGWNGGYGNYVMINHGNGYTTLYAHMSQLAVSVGQTVSMGQTIGYVGSTGNSTGPHLHFEVRSSSSGSTMDPMSFSYY